MTDELRSFEADSSRTDVAAALRSIADGFDGGDTLQVILDDRSRSLALAESFSFELEIERESSDGNGDEPGHEIELEIDIEWTEPTDLEARTDSEPETERTHGSGSEQRSTREIDGNETVSGDERVRTEPVESLGEFQLFEDRADEWRWRLVHRNGNIIATSGEGYTTKQNARKGIQSVLENAPEAEVTDLSDSNAT